jgi:hypothetical protein
MKYRVALKSVHLRHSALTETLSSEHVSARAVLNWHPTPKRTGRLTVGRNVTLANWNPVYRLSRDKMLYAPHGHSSEFCSCSAGQEVHSSYGGGRGRAVMQWLRHCATILKVTGSRPDEMKEFFFSIYPILSVSNRNEYQKQKNNVSGE